MQWADGLAEQLAKIETVNQGFAKRYASLLLSQHAGMQWADGLAEQSSQRKKSKTSSKTSSKRETHEANTAGEAAPLPRDVAS